MAGRRREPPGRSRALRRSDTVRRKPALSIIGAGRLGTALAIALSRRGYTVEAVVARHLKHARRAASLIQSDPRALTNRQLDLLPRNSLLFITTPDDALMEITRELAASVPTTGGQRIALHTSGALSSAVLSPLRKAGFHTGSMHPLVSVSDSLTGAGSLQGAFYCVEGDAAAVRTARAIVRDLKGQSFSIDTEEKALYHAAAVMASGHVVALFDIALDMLAHCGLSPRRARAVLIPLLRSTLENLNAHEPARALTGTFARADAATVRRHLRALHEQGSHDALAAYRLLGLRSLQLVAETGADRAALREIARRLNEKRLSKANER